MRLFPVVVQFRLEVKMESYFCRDEFRDSEFVVWFFFVAMPFGEKFGIPAFVFWEVTVLGLRTPSLLENFLEESSNKFLREFRCV